MNNFKLLGMAVLFVLVGVSTLTVLLIAVFELVVYSSLTQFVSLLEIFLNPANWKFFAFI